jgi:hypothetical protein
MIAQDKVFIYQKYAGDYSAWAKQANPLEKSIMDASDWPQISELLWKLSEVKAGIVQPVQINEVRKKMFDQVDSDPTRKLLFDIA